MTIEQRKFIVESLIETKSNVEARRILFAKFHFRVSKKAIWAVNSKWKADATARNGRSVTAENVEIVRPVVDSERNISVSRFSCVTGIEPTSVRRILNKDLGFKLKDIHEMKEGYGWNFVVKLISSSMKNNLMSAISFFSDESHIYLK